MKMKFLLLMLLGSVGMAWGTDKEHRAAEEVMGHLNSQSHLHRHTTSTMMEQLAPLNGDLDDLEKVADELAEALRSASSDAEIASINASLNINKAKIKQRRKEKESREAMILEAARQHAALHYRALGSKLDAGAGERVQALEVAKIREHALASKDTLIQINQDTNESRERMLKYTVPAVGLGAAGLMTLAFIFKKLSVPRPKIIERGDTSMLSWYERNILKLKVPASRIDSVVLAPMKRKMVIDKFASIGQAIKKHLPLSNMLFYGRPGTGKTMAAEAFARRLYEQGLAHYVIIRGGAFKRLNSAGAAQAELANVLRWARTSKLPVILIFDEAESLFLDRSSSIATETSKDLVTTLLSFFPKAVDAQMMFIMCTNRKDDLDPAIISRIERSLRQEFDAPGEAELAKMLDIYFKEHIIGNGFKVDAALTSDKPNIVKMLDGYVGRDIDALMVQALYGVLAQNKKLLDKPTLLEAIKATPPLDVPIEVAA